MSEAIKPVWSAGFRTVTVQETEEHVAADIRIFCGNPDFTKRISRLIAEAGTVHHETGLTPRQLVEQRDALARELEAVQYWAVTERVALRKQEIDSIGRALALVTGAPQ